MGFSRVGAQSFMDELDLEYHGLATTSMFEGGRPVERSVSSSDDNPSSADMRKKKEPTFVFLDVPT